MPRAVRFNEYGGIDVLLVAEVDRPVPAAGQVLVQVKAAGINPGEAAIRQGFLHQRWPATFPSGEGTDFAGVVTETGEGVAGFRRGDEVIGYTDNRASHADFVVAEAGNLTAKPPKVSWEEAGALPVAGFTAYAAVRAVAPRQGKTVAGRIRDASGGKVDAFIDTFGADYVELALELGVRPGRIDTVANFQAVEKYGVKAEGNMAGASADVLAELAGMIDKGILEIPIARVYPLDQVQDAYRELEKRHTRGKIVLKP